MGAAGDRREGDAAGADRGRAVALLSGECLEHRRGGPVPGRRDHRRLARGRDARHRTPATGCCPRCCCSARSAVPLYAAIPALFKVRFGASEILTSLMLVYVAELLLDYLVRGPWRDPKGFNFPTTAEFDAVASMPTLDRGQPPASRRDHRAAGGDLGDRHARPHVARLRDQAGRRRAARRALRRLQRQDADRGDLR